MKQLKENPMFSQLTKKKNTNLSINHSIILSIEFRLMKLHKRIPPTHTHTHTYTHTHTHIHFFSTFFDTYVMTRAMIHYFSV